jgi:NAD(P)-dependent dehydrogenase (short-subunit alcohol dehydrogenase family)
VGKKDIQRPRIHPGTASFFMTGVEDRVALITGASRGIGLATAKLFVSNGARVMAVARSESDLAATGLPNTVVADLSTLDGCKHAVDETIRRLGPIDILVCNHGIGSAHEQPLHLQDVAVYHDSMRTNLDGPFYLTRLVMPSMVERKYGRCVYTSSTAAIEAEPAGVGYNVSKSGLCGLMRSVCQDGGPYNITSNAVLPGWVRTEMAEKSAQAEAAAKGVTVEEVWEGRAALYPPKRVVKPKEVAHTILFLASEESSGVSGESVRVCLGCPW